MWGVIWQRSSQKNWDASSNVGSRKWESLRKAFWKGPLWDKVIIIMKRTKKERLWEKKKMIFEYQ